MFLEYSFPDTFIDDLSPACKVWLVTEIFMSLSMPWYSVLPSPLSAVSNILRDNGFAVYHADKAVVFVL